MDSDLIDPKKKRRKGENSSDIGVLGYSDSMNPFGDPHLSKRFKWKAKDGSSSSTDVLKSSKTSMKSMLDEILKARSSREQRELESEEREMERIRQLRDVNIEWEKSEEAFIQEQTRLRTQLRLKEGRGSYLDILAGTLNGEAHGAKLLVPPWRFFRLIDAKNFAEVKKELETHARISGHEDFWELMMVLYRMEREERMRGSEKRYLVSKVILEEIDSLLRGKTVLELTQLKSETEEYLVSGVTVDEDYWDAFLARLELFFTIAHVKEFYSEAVRKHDISEKDADGDEVALPDSSANTRYQSGTEKRGKAKFEKESGRFSPIYYSVDDFDAEEIISPELDLDLLRKMRKEVLFNGNISGGGRSIDMKDTSGKSVCMKCAKFNANWAEWQLETILFEYEKNKPVSENTVEFNDVVDLAGSKSWEGKYEPRKPRYFNRVHYGYIWTKYAQTHFDTENPPPKTIVGYKFNIFYPDLIEKGKSPTYMLHPSDSEGCVIIHFSAGPPYEDIAFKIANKEWEFSHRKGFHCSFDNGIFRLFLNFKRARYKR